MQQQLEPEQHNIAQAKDKSEHALPGHGVLLTLLKSFEEELQQRACLPQGRSSDFNPLWFFSETEVNICLWRRGCSIIERDDFCFWVDCAALIEKRISQLRAADPTNPFHNQFWGFAFYDETVIARETDYLLSLGALLKKSASHLYALSVVQHEIALSYDEMEREVILLPYSAEP